MESVCKRSSITHQTTRGAVATRSSTTCTNYPMAAWEWVLFCAKYRAMLNPKCYLNTEWHSIFFYYFPNDGPTMCKNCEVASSSLPSRRLPFLPFVHEKIYRAPEARHRTALPSQWPPLVSEWSVRVSTDRSRLHRPKWDRITSTSIMAMDWSDFGEEVEVVLDSSLTATTTTDLWPTATATGPRISAAR